MCKKIHRGGNAEQYNADKKYKEAVAVAAEACADDTKGQTCYICTQALHWKTKEGLVRGCACRGTAGFAHVSCLAEQAKILCDEAEANNWFGTERGNACWTRWFECSLCEQRYHGVVYCALGWACWKTYVGRPEADWVRGAAINILGNGLHDAKHDQDALFVREAELSMLRRLGASKDSMLVVQTNIANTYARMGRLEEALQMRQEVYSGRLKLHGKEHGRTSLAANNYADSLNDLGRFKEVKSLLRKAIPVARCVLGEGHNVTFRMRKGYACALYEDPDATLDDLREAVTALEETERTARRVLGGAHPLTTGIEKSLRDARAALRARETAVAGARYDARETPSPGRDKN
jgi:tetratricopeptide (TPR) repeat protein